MSLGYVSCLRKGGRIMTRCRLFALVGLAFVAGNLCAEAPRFQFRKGETLAYHIVQTTRISEVVLDEKTNKPVEVEATTKVDLVRKWKVAEVDDKGIATLEMTIASMRLERKAGTDEDVFDSSKPDDLNKNEIARHIGPVLAVVRIDTQGRLVEVKESKVGAADRFVTDLPFKLTLLDTEPKPGESWDRRYTIQLDPPHGTGEKYAAVQKYTCQQPTKELLTVALTTDVKEMPTESEQIPLLPMMPEGTLYFHVSSGRYYAARLKTQKEVKNHQGEGSSYKYQSTYVEDLVPEK
jgi:hypothetical protein